MALRCRLGFFTMGLLALTACETVERTDREVPISERVLHERAQATRLLPWIDPVLKQSEDLSLSPLFQQTVERLSSPSPFLRGMRFQVLVAEDMLTRWQSVAIAGRKMVLPRSVLKRLEFENQLAALIAIELAHVQKRTLLNRFEQGEYELREKIGTATSAQRLLAFGEEECMDAVKLAIQLLYKARYDIRGVSLLWDLYAQAPQASPFSPRLLKRLRELTRSEIVQYPPVVDPIVRSDGFVKIQKRLKEL